MTESMVEKVAMALEPFFSSADIAYKEHVQAARTAIEAMSTPTTQMLFEGVVAQDSEDPAVQRIYTAMIQAALTEGTGE